MSAPSGTDPRAGVPARSGPRITVSAEAIAHNVHRVIESTGMPVIVIVKAGGYGHGAVLAAHAALAGGAVALGVVDLAEAAELRAADVRAPLLAWMNAPEPALATARALDVQLVLTSPEQVDRVIAAGEDAAAQSSPPGPFIVQLKVDTGLGRNGVRPEHWAGVFERLAAAAERGEIVVAGVMSHLANAGNAADSAQRAEFARARALAESAGLTDCVWHLAASESALNGGGADTDAVRVGLAAYGYIADAQTHTGDAPARLALEPAMRVDADVLEVHRGGDGAVSITVDAGFVDGVLPGGWRDPGVLVAAGEGESVRARLAPGETSHATTTRLRLDEAPAVLPSPGDVVSLLAGPGDAEAWARGAGTIHYEVLTRIGASVQPALDLGLPGLPERVAEIDLAALRANLAALVAERGSSADASPLVLDVTADAYGHSLALVGPVAASVPGVVLGSWRPARDAAAARESAPSALWTPPELRDLADAAPDSIVAADAYGLGRPSAGERELRPVLRRVRACPLRVTTLPEGTGVSYGRTYVTPADERVALVPLGYADGMLRAAGEDAWVSISGVRCPVRGRIAMDQLIVDVSDADRVREVDVAATVDVVGGAGASALEWARWCRLESPLAFTAGLGRRVRREAVA